MAGLRQEFHRGDLVWIRDQYWHDPELGEYSTNLKGVIRTPATFAIIVGSYRDKYGGGERERHIYSILTLDKKGQALYSSSWTPAAAIEVLVQERCIELLDILDFYDEEVNDYEDE